MENKSNELKKSSAEKLCTKSAPTFTNTSKYCTGFYDFFEQDNGLNLLKAT